MCRGVLKEPREVVDRPGPRPVLQRQLRAAIEKVDQARSSALHLSRGHKADALPQEAREAWSAYNAAALKLDELIRRV